MPRIKSFDEEVVLKKAMNLFWRKGFYATSMQDVVDELGINRASIYDTFGDKKQLFLKALYYYRKTSLSDLKTFLYSQSSVKDGFLRLFLAMIDEIDKDIKGCFVVNTTTELTGHDDVIKLSIQENQIVFVDLFYDHLQTGVQRGEISPQKDLKALALFLFTLNNGIRVLLKTASSKEELKKMVRVSMTILD